ncbi:hypothetical protein [Jeotgalibacillus campisalis]|uniref:Uncharacterized protein n=1 Tax=Jeotgalibacillus campisalis TaxID=220754 RepID=A0A0C2R6U9_9BACL|nr:hypothetical protein [Jeotgalibacillus campisalis]KIL45975.1 hypothetical protein KR50_26500 [Jeotgalibacillus campisalis]
MAKKEREDLGHIIKSQAGSLMLPALLSFSTVIFIAGGLSATCMAQINHYEKLNAYYESEAMVEFKKVKSIRSIESRSASESLIDRTKH